MKTGQELIAEERVRQVNGEGWTAAHDDEHQRDGSLAMAARCYEHEAEYQREGRPPAEEKPLGWPWGESWWKPHGGPVRLFTKAGALYRAEAARLNRMAGGLGAGAMFRCSDACAAKIDELQAEKI